MASEKTEALVLRVVEFSETSLIVTLMTRDFGKLGAMAKGARRPKSAFEGALDLLAVCRVVIIRKSGDTLDLLTEAKLERRFRAGLRDLKRLYAGYYVAELLRELTDPHDPAPDLFDLANDALLELDGDTEVDACLLRFELRMLRLIGHTPILTSCAVCGVAVDPSAEQRIPFSCLSGGVVCSACRQGARGLTLLKRETVEWMLQLSGDDHKLATAPTPPTSSRGELRGVMNHYMSHLIGAAPRLRNYITGASATS